MRVKWDESGKRFFETGVRNGMLYPQAADGSYPLGVAWNGLTAVNESPSGAESTPLYADDIKYLNLISAEEFGASIEAYMYPKEFEECNGEASLVPGVVIGQQTRKAFGFSFRTAIGNDIDGNEHGYKLHLIYGAMASPSERAYATINDSPEAITFSWEVTTTPVSVSGFKPTASLVLDSTNFTEQQMAAVENALYGTDSTNPRLPLPDEIATIMGSAAVYSCLTYFTNVSASNKALSVAANEAYTSTLSAKDGYEMANVIVTMGGEDVTTTVYTSGTGVISISSVTGDIVIYATANEE